MPHTSRLAQTIPQPFPHDPHDRPGTVGFLAELGPPAEMADLATGAEEAFTENPMASVSKTDVAASRQKTRGALLQGLRTGKLEEAVNKMEYDVAAEEGLQAKSPSKSSYDTGKLFAALEEKAILEAEKRNCCPLPVMACLKFAVHPHNKEVPTHPLLFPRRRVSHSFTWPPPLKQARLPPLLSLPTASVVLSCFANPSASCGTSSSWFWSSIPRWPSRTRPHSRKGR